MKREITFVMNFDDYSKCPEDLKKYIQTSGREPLNGVYTNTIAEGNESQKLSKVVDRIYSIVDDFDLGSITEEKAIGRFRELSKVLA